MACTVCSHADVDEIDAALAAGTPLRQIGERYGLTKDAVQRHKKAHLPGALVPLTGVVVESERARVHDRLEGLYGTVEKLLQTALDAGKGPQALNTIREARMCLELIAKITGELDERSVQVINLQAAPEWLAVRAAIIGALADYPEARLAVSRGLVALEAAS